jgi:hypothetical protein
MTVVERMRRRSADPEFLVVLTFNPSENKTSGEPEASESYLSSIGHGAWRNEELGFDRFVFD